MDPRPLMDQLLAEVAGLLATLATLGGHRVLVADLPDRLFHHLALALEARGLSKKLVADMSGLVLRSYQKRMQRLERSRSDAGVTLWEATLGYLVERRIATRVELERRFSRDDTQTLGSVLHDLVEGGLVFRAGAGASAVYRVADDAELALAPVPGEHEGLVWLHVYRQSRVRPVTFEELARGLPTLTRDELEGALEVLLGEGRVSCVPGESGYRCRSLVVGPTEAGGAGAAIADHVHAVFTTLGNALVWAADDPRRAHCGGSTYSLEVAAGDPHEAEVVGLLARLRAELTALREKADGEPEREGAARVAIYCGVTEVGGDRRQATGMGRGVVGAAGDEDGGRDG